VKLGQLGVLVTVLSGATMGVWAWSGRRPIARALLADLAVDKFADDV